VQLPQQPQPPYFNSYNFAMVEFAEDFVGMMIFDVPQFELELP
ncbi:hypothetical protein A2U01_0097151, partial [Trifolium medium]|nr:hypothetical protein [Trifolium medium]